MNGIHSHSIGLNRTIASQYIWPAVLLLSFSAVFIERNLRLGILLQLDELIILIGVAGGFATQLLSQKISKLILFYIILLMVISVVSLAGGYAQSIPTSILACFLYLKLPLLLYIFRSMPSYDLSRLMNWFFLFLLIGGVLSLVFNAYFESLLPDVTWYLDPGRMMGFFVSPNRQAALASVLFLYFYFIRKQRSVAFLCFAILFLTESRSMFILAIMLFLYCYHQFVSKLSLLVLSPVLVLATAYFLVFEFEILETLDFITGTLDADLRYIRAAMLAGGIFLAIEYFPFGAGGGTFGSPLSRGSQAYNDVGIGHWDSVLDGSGIHDSGIGTMFGEFGVFGVVVLVVALYASFRSWSRNILIRRDLIVILFMILFLSLFRQVISNFYFSFITIGYAYIILQLRWSKSNAYT